MAFGLFDRVWDGATTTGSGPIELTGVAPLGFRPFNSKMNVGDTTYVCVSNQARTEWCTALGTYTATNEITLGTIFDSSNGGAAVSFSLGQKDVYIVDPAAAPGISGPTGATGPAGATGSAGATGATGSAGAAAIQIGVTPANGTPKSILFTDGSFVQSMPAWYDATNNNLAIGSSLPTLGTPNYNVGYGYKALNAITSGGDNCGIGAFALSKNTSGGYNTAIGAQSLYDNTIGNYNVGIGYLTLYQNISGVYNFGVGTQALGYNTSGSYNSAVGSSALLNNTTGSYNVAIGNASGGGITTGSNNTIIGSGVTGLPSGLTGSVILATGDGTIQLDYNKTNPGAWTFPTPPILPTYTIAQLLAIASPVAGMQAFVSDTVALAAPTWHGAVSGGGSVTVAAPVFYAAGAWQYT